ncbi:MAG: hypothetical protein IPG69_14545 [Flavobacteriales bacterium]|nr:hypothetical protein [Flavobacteriales bacterium]
MWWHSTMNAWCMPGGKAVVYTGICPSRRMTGARRGDGVEIATPLPAMATSTEPGHAGPGVGLALKRGIVSENPNGL